MKNMKAVYGITHCMRYAQRERLGYIPKNSFRNSVSGVPYPISATVMAKFVVDEPPPKKRHLVVHMVACVCTRGEFATVETTF